MTLCKLLLKAGVLFTSCHFFCRQEATKSLDITEALKLPPEALDRAITLELDLASYIFNLHACLGVDAEKCALVSNVEPGE